MRKLTLVFGRICSGKSTVASQICAAYPVDPICISVSDVVRSLSGFDRRSDLQTTASKAEEIANGILRIADVHANVVVEGIRQAEIVERITPYFDVVEMYYVDALESVRRERYTQRANRKDDVTFEQAEAADDALGMRDLYVTYRHAVKHITN